MKFCLRRSGRSVPYLDSLCDSSVSSILDDAIHPLPSTVFATRQKLHPLSNLDDLSPKSDSLATRQKIYSIEQNFGLCNDQFLIWNVRALIVLKEEFRIQRVYILLSSAYFFVGLVLICNVLFVAVHLVFHNVP